MDKANQEKPEKPEDFKKPVVWLLGRQLVASLKGVALYAAYKGKVDARDWMEPSEEDLSDSAKRNNKAQPETEFWFDYIADTGDGQKATYSIAYLCLSNLWVKRDHSQDKNVQFDFAKDGEHDLALPRGEFLYVGGDTSYHIADYISLASRFQSPFRWAFKNVKTDLENADKKMDETRRPIYGIPGNHDYYDMLDGFNRQFRRPLKGEEAADRRGNLPQLAIPGFRREQTASYVAIALPFGWWFWGLDIEVGKLDERQHDFFMSRNKGKQPRRLIVSTPEPSTVFGKLAEADSPLSEVFRDLKLERPFLEDGSLKPDKCRLDLSGDTHHYARYWGPDTRGEFKPEKKDGPRRALSSENYASVVSGLGGAFHHPSTTDVGEVEEQELYPPKPVSRKAIAENILNYWKLFEGGYLWLFGAIAAVVVYFAATVPPSTKPLVDSILRWINPDVIYSESMMPGLFAKTDLPTSGACNLAVPIILIFIFIAAAGVGLFLSKKEINDKAHSDSTKEQEAFDQVMKQRRRLLTRWAVVTASLVALFVDLWFIRKCRTELPSFACSLLVLASFAGAMLAVIESAFYSEWLVRKARKVSIRERDYWPVGTLTALAAILFCGGLLMFGIYPAGYLFFDLVFASTVLLTVMGLILLAALLGASLHKTVGKILFSILGLWYAVLQLATPFLLVRADNLIVLLVSLVIVVHLFRRLGITIVKRTDKLLAPTWIIYGVVMVGLPVFSLMRPGAIPGSLSGVPYWSKLLLVAIIGGLITHVWIGWYMAVALAFNGHNSEAGGAARIENFKQLIRIRLTADSLTGYVIAVDEPQTDGNKLKPKIVDVFKLKYSGPPHD